MGKLTETLAGAVAVVKRSIVVVSKNDIYKFPEGCSFDITFNEAGEKVGKNYKGYNIYKLTLANLPYYVCIQSERYNESEITELILLSIKASLDEDDSLTECFRRIVGGKCDGAELMKLEEEFRGYLPGNILLIDNYRDSGEEVLEILLNTANIACSFKYDDRIVAIAKDENIEEVCSSFNKNILSELLIECTVVIGGYAKSIGELKEKYEDCLKGLYIKHIYSLPDNVLNFGDMYGYRIVAGLDKKLKEYIREKVFTPEFKDMMNSELGITIEEFFKNNLNLTDTAAKLYIHRNTLLYRLDKIYKSTGFDLKKFEDSWLFKLAWLIRKEKGL
ncbi:MAG: PucR family transcriptional regulator [Caulobacteraceae bacterium]